MDDDHRCPRKLALLSRLGRFRLFEMPVVGYLGYLSFGAACLAFRLLLLPLPGPKMSTGTADGGRELLPLQAAGRFQAPMSRPGEGWSTIDPMNELERTGMGPDRRAGKAAATVAA